MRTDWLIDHTPFTVRSPGPSTHLDENGRLTARVSVCVNRFPEHSTARVAAGSAESVHPRSVARRQRQHARLALSLGLEMQS
jgi:hypothetical protein